MYNLIVWDKGLAAAGQDGALNRLDIPMDMARFFFELSAENFPILSSLSFDDYDFFSGEQIDSLVYELTEVVKINPAASKLVDSMLKVISEARSFEKSIMFDPFGG